MTSAIASQTFPLYSPARHWPAGAFAVWLRLLVPGYTQWSWGQRHRGLVMGGTYASALATSLLIWGHPSSWFFLGVAVACQTAAWLDAQRQDPFSGFTPTSVLAATGGGVSLALHAPLFILLTLTAWPGQPDDASRGGYLVNWLAYQNNLPAPGHWIWLRGSASRDHHLARVVAVGGQEVEWTGKRWMVDGANVEVESMRKLSGYPEGWKFRVPGNHIAIDPDIDLNAGKTSASLYLVENGQILGRVWARYTPFWERRLL
ncbi:hypothetical protein [Paludisphaera borealis]|uniref:Peptidase S26 domain-containing protein n=1 Tax=Paludisphaera borealis TaxID=1387353 RepID=A0A1U7CMS1_9BACT|nr:hypothetical protein [Paludisphaera borealis]APW60232.1 hypothetical protein BSF38_01699 [Paludisphaera borealis]